MYFKKNIAIAFAIFHLNSCTSPQVAIAPVINPKTQKIIAVKPNTGKYTIKTPTSEVQKVSEDGFRSIDEKWMERNLGPFPDGAGCSASLITKIGFKKTVSQNPDGRVIPIIVIKYINIPKDKIETAIPKLQSIVYRNLSLKYQVINF